MQSPSRNWLNSRNNNNQLDLLRLRKRNTRYALEGYKLFFSDKLARQYEPIIYAGDCMSGDAEALYYRILKNHKDELCIQYIYYWKYQECMMTSQGYDYEPIFIYLKPNNPSPYLIVNGGLGDPRCYFHKNEIRPRKGKRHGHTRRIHANLSRFLFYPFGQDGRIKKPYVWRLIHCVQVLTFNLKRSIAHFLESGHAPMFLVEPKETYVDIDLTPL